jgi:hypothetical protein
MVDMRYVSPYLNPSAYWQARKPFDQLIVSATGSGFGPDSIFERLEVGDGQVRFRSRGEYLWIGSPPNRGLYIGGTEPTVESTFREIWHDDDRISLLSARNQFVCAEGGGGDRIVVDRSEIGDWERFYYAVPPADLIKALFPASAASPIKVDHATRVDDEARRLPPILDPPAHPRLDERAHLRNPFLPPG